MIKVTFLVIQTPEKVEIPRRQMLECDITNKFHFGSYWQKICAPPHNFSRVLHFLKGGREGIQVLLGC